MSQAAIANRCLDLLELLASVPEGLPLTTLAQRLDLAKSATHRLLAALQAEGCVAQEPHRQVYRITPRVPLMGLRHLAATGIVSACQPLLGELAARTGELVRLTVAEDGNLVWVAKAQGAKSELRFDPEMGQEVRLHTTATGKAWLASLPDDEALRILRAHVPASRRRGKVSIEQVMRGVHEARRRGYGLAIDEDEVGMSAVAAVIPGRHPLDRAVGTVSVAGPSVRLTRSQLDAIAKDLLATAQRLAEVWPQSTDAELAGHAPPPTRRRAYKAAARPRPRPVPPTEKPGRPAAAARNGK